jgi:CheY-like chemotaxis protein
MTSRIATVPRQPAVCLLLLALAALASASDSQPLRIAGSGWVADAPTKIADQLGAFNEPGILPEIKVVNYNSILVVEDDDLVRQYVHTLLKSLGYNVLTANNGNAALEALASNPDVDLLFTDVVMPGGMSGRDLADEVQRLHPGMRVLYTSGYSDNVIVHQGRLDPSVVLLSKPYRREDLAASVRKALSADS